MLSLPKRTILVTGCAGFIGFHVVSKLLNLGAKIIGIDSLNNYYDVELKKARLKILQSKNSSDFIFCKLDLTDYESIAKFSAQYSQIEYIIHLAAQAGVRYSLIKPFAYVSNISGQLAILELAKALPNLIHLVYASSSSAYGANAKLPFAISDRVDAPISLYAATKISCELMSYSYSHLFNLTISGLRYFTVYGPWGRPDMSAFIFTKAILAGESLPVYNNGNMRRNFTYIDDIVDGTIACLLSRDQSNGKHRLYNIGNKRSEALMDFIRILEKLLGTKANLNLQPMQPGDIEETIADISEATQDFGFEPKTNIDAGLQEFIKWYRNYCLE